MKHSLHLLCAGVLSCSTLGWAQEVGQVLSSEPVIQQVAVPQHICTTTQVEVTPPKTGTGAVLGALTGGALGSAGGHGASAALGTVLGVVGGAIVGDRLEPSPTAQLQTVRQCQLQTSYENRTVAYNVVYAYAGRQYTVQMPSAPGATIPLQISPIGATPTAPAAAPVIASSPTNTYVAPTVIETQVIYQPYFPRPIYTYSAPIWIRAGYGHHHRERHWR